MHLHFVECTPPKQQEQQQTLLCVALKSTVSSISENVCNDGSNLSQPALVIMQQSR